MMIPFDKIALIGSGNVAYAYNKALKNNGIHPFCVFTRSLDKISEIEEKFGVMATSSLKATSDFNDLFDSDLIIIAVKDDAIAEVALNLKKYKGLLVHTSGTQPSSVLNHIENYGVLYPLQTLTKGFDVDFKKVPLLINASSSIYLIFSDKITDFREEQP